ncbi:MAG: hypothetical protein ABC360_10165 [Acetomicrobium sp.]
MTKVQIMSLFTALFLFLFLFPIAISKQTFFPSRYMLMMSKMKQNLKYMRIGLQ